MSRRGPWCLEGAGGSSGKPSSDMSARALSPVTAMTLATAVSGGASSAEAGLRSCPRPCRPQGSGRDQAGWGAAGPGAWAPCSRNCKAGGVRRHRGGLQPEEQAHERRHAVARCIRSQAAEAERGSGLGTKSTSPRSGPVLTDLTGEGLALAAGLRPGPTASTRVIITPPCGGLSARPATLGRRSPDIALWRSAQP